MVVAGGLPDEAEIPWIKEVRAATCDSLVKNETERFARADAMLGQALLAVANKSNETIQFGVGAKRLEIRKGQAYVMRGGGQMLWMILEYFKTNQL